MNLILNFECVPFVYYVLLAGHYTTLIFLFLFIVCVHMHATACLQRSENEFVELFLFLFGFWRWNSVDRLLPVLLYPLSHLARPGLLRYYDLNEAFPDHLLKFTLVTIICLNVSFSNFMMALINI